MAVKTDLYSPSKTAQDTGLGPSNSIWADCPVADFYGSGFQENNKGVHFMDHFISTGILTTNAADSFNSDRNWLGYANTNAVIDTDPQQDFGVLALGAGSNNNVNICLTQANGSMRMVSAATGNALTQGRLWFEARIAVGSIAASKRDIFIGLSDNGPVIAANNGFFSAADTISTTPGFFGFRSRGGATAPADFGVVWNVAGGTVQAPTTGGMNTIVNNVTGANVVAYAAGATGALASNFVKLGFRYDPNANADLITTAVGGQVVGQQKKRLIDIFVNGQHMGGYLTAADQVQLTTFPNSWMSPTIVYRSASATAPGDLYIDWIRVAQEANAP